MAPHIALLGRAVAFSFVFTSQKDKSGPISNPCQNELSFPTTHTSTLVAPRKSQIKIRRTISRTKCFSHSTIISPYSPPYFDPATEQQQLRVTSPHLSATEQDLEQQQIAEDENTAWGSRSKNSLRSRHISSSISDLCELLGAMPTDLLRIDYDEEDGERGVYLNRHINEGYALLKLPVSSCLQDDAPPSWLFDRKEDEDEVKNEDLINHHDHHHYNPSEWAMSLAASLIDLHLREVINEKDHTVDEGMDLWLSTLPDKKFLRASLPIHWPDDILQNAKCTALELAVDSAYFARAEAVETLLSALQLRQPSLIEHLDDDKVRRLCHDALDVVQTRTCRVERHIGAGMLGPPLRLLAPIFDLINHGSARCKTLRNGCANASFDLEVDDKTGEEFLIVRTTRDINADEEVLLDYGESARPAWRCLASYGFVPDYRIPKEDEVADEEQDEDDVAEVFMDGIRYEVGPTNVPFELVEGAAASICVEETGGAVSTFAVEQLDDDEYDYDYGGDYDIFGADSKEPFLAPPEDETHEPTDAVASDGEVQLTPAVALHIAKRVSDVAFMLLLEPEVAENDATKPEDILAARLAASLRWDQHKVLLSCAVNLRDYAARPQ